MTYLTQCLLSRHKFRVSASLKKSWIHTALMFRTNRLKLKKDYAVCEAFLGSVSPYEICKVFPLDACSVVYLVRNSHMKTCDWVLVRRSFVPPPYIYLSPYRQLVVKIRWKWENFKSQWVDSWTQWLSDVVGIDFHMITGNISVYYVSATKRSET